ncbi:exodeoxyribonuclease III [Corticimicrobacter populi]|uniref:Exodeoxyribonuclease III n=1 Tax=Corticimicrobacter populi TaxID=2175229 RepID=A0A2V1JVN6_9BURK|nr:exodeoxyribonuclease III [Corticimicrobacter populi]PWF22258.1 exodeoxyribonuclease III [Corticimicrobacter populi]
MLRIISLNLNGIRSAFRKGLQPWLAQQQADIVCLQELKAQDADLTDDMRTPLDYTGHFFSAEKKGYSGVGLYLRRPAERVLDGMGCEEFDTEGRIIRADWPGLSVISAYLPSGSSGDERQQAKYRFLDHFGPWLDALATEHRDTGREFVICGDWNIAHHEIDLKNWRGNRKNSGFLPEERAWLSTVFDQRGFVDVYRSLHPEATDAAYTWWSNRGQAWANNVGWRIDYQIATPGIAALARHCAIYKDERFSDHAPLIIDYDWHGFSA